MGSSGRSIPVQVSIEEALRQLPPGDETDAIWRSWATRLDTSDALYLLPEDYDVIARATGSRVPYVEVICGPITMRLIERASSHESTPKFWHKNLEGMDSSMVKLAQILDEDLSGEMKPLWQRAYEESVYYFRYHRKLVRGVGDLLNVNMDDHDLTKTSLVLYALGYLWHWPGEKPAGEDLRKDVAWAVVREGHLQREDHHPEFAGDGPVSAEKLFCDRLAVHLQKDPDDGLAGWDINAKWLPAMLMPEWHTFLEKYRHINLRQTLSSEFPSAPLVNM